MQNSLVMFTFFIFRPKIIFFSKIVCLIWNLILRPLRTYSIWWWCSFFYYTRNRLFEEIWINKLKLCEIIITRIIWMNWIWWRCSLFLFWTWNTIFGRIWSKKSKIICLSQNLESKLLQISWTLTATFLTSLITNGIAKSSKEKQSLQENYLQKKPTVCETFYKDYEKLFEAVKRKSVKNYFSELLLKHKDDLKKHGKYLKEW